MAKRASLEDRVNNVKTPVKPRDMLFQPTTPTVKEELPRQTYFLNKELIEAIRIMSFKDSKQKSVLVRELLYNSIPTEIIEEARKNISNM